MIHRPAFAPHLRVDILPDVGIQLSGEQVAKFLEGEVFIALAEALRRGLSREQLLETASGDERREQLSEALDHLEGSGVLIEADHGSATATPQAIYWSRRGPGPATAPSLRCAVATVGAPAPELVGSLRIALERAGIDHSADAASAEVVVVLAEDYLHEELAAWNKRMLEAARPWLLVRPVGVEPWVGPFFVPQKTGCWECLAQRLRYNRPMHALQASEQETGYLSVPQGWLPTTVDVATRVAATELATYARSKATVLRGAVESINTGTWEVERHRLVRQPQCPACGTAPEEGSPRIVLVARPIVEGVEGYRARKPEELFRAFEHHVSTITGVVPNITANAQAVRLGLHAFRSGLNSAVVNPRSLTQRGGVRHHSGGKGKTEIQAKMGALAEALERYSMSAPPAAELARRRRARYDELPPGQALAPPELLGFTEAQYRDRLKLNVAGSYNRIPPPWDPQRPLTWTQAWSLRHDAIRFVPAQFCYMYDPAFGADGPCCICDSNGVAAGATFEDAILQGFFELIERDAVGIWFYNKIERPRVDLDSLNDPYIEQVRSVLAERGRDFWIVDLTHDFGIPVYAAMMRRRDERQRANVMFGFGAHQDASMALARAASELIQLGASFLGVSADDDADEARGPDMARWMKEATLDSQAFLLGKNLPPVKLPASPQAKSVTEQVERCIQACANHGLDFIVFDHTMPDIRFPVARVIVPGVRHFRQRFGPGRLYDVPVALGWLPRKKTEAELNEFGMPC